MNSATIKEAPHPPETRHAGVLPTINDHVSVRLVDPELDQLEMIIYRLNEEKIPHVPVVENIYRDFDDKNVFYVTLGVERLHNIDILTEEMIKDIQGVLWALRDLRLSIKVRSKKELVDMFAVDSVGNIQLVDLSKLEFNWLRKKADNSIDIALSFIN